MGTRFFLDQSNLRYFYGEYRIFECDSRLQTENDDNASNLCATRTTARERESYLLRGTNARAADDVLDNHNLLYDLQHG